MELFNIKLIKSFLNLQCLLHFWDIQVICLYCYLSVGLDILIYNTNPQQLNEFFATILHHFLAKRDAFLLGVDIGLYNKVTKVMST